MKRVIVLALGAVLSFSTEALAGEAAKLAAQAEAQAAKGEHVNAIDSMRQALMKVWQKSSIAIKRAIFIKREAAGFGIYDARPNSVFTKDEKMLVYAEPVGFSWTKAEAIFKSDISVDFKLKTPKGQVLAEKEAFGRFNTASRAQNTEFYMNLNFKFTGLTAGKYVLTTTYHDKIGAKSTTVDLPFEVQ